MSKKDESNKYEKDWVACDVESHYFGTDRKHSKKEKKLAIAKDRSKYKKTDQAKLQKSQKQKAYIPTDQDRRGRVISIKPEGFFVENETSSEIIVCSLKGALKKEKNLSKNLVTVGDFVLYNEVNKTITYIEPRKSLLSRADNLSRRKEQFIAANVDQVIITVSVVSPEIKPFLIDRYIIAAVKGNLTPIIVVNKIDLLQDETKENPLIEVQKEIYEEVLAAYTKAKISIIGVSVVTGEGLEDLKKIMQGKTSVFSGQSGVGKSSLINIICGTELRTGEIVSKTKKGSHTTTTTKLIQLSFGGWCVDTPGVKSFGVWDLKKNELKSYFTEIEKYGQSCKYQDCSHIQEEDCAVIKAVEEGKISLLRYQSYQMLLQDLEEEYLRR